LHAIREAVLALAKPVLRHRIRMSADSKNFGYSPDELIDDILRKMVLDIQ
jgi:hypothetical protein